MENFSRAVIVSFFNYQHGDPTLLWRFFQIHMKKWTKYVSNVYIIDSGCGLQEYSDNRVKIIRKPAQSHWQNFNEVIRQTQEEDICLMDSDMIIYNPEVIDKYFKELQNYDVASIMDSSGSEDLFGPDKRRLAPYLCFLKKSALPPDFDFTPHGGAAWQDSMGYVSKQLKDKKILEIPDDRSNIYLEDDGTIKHEQWLPGTDIPENPNYGYYHIRNFGGGLKIAHEGITTEPGREARRLLSWFQFVTEKAEGACSLINLNQDYYQEFKNYYPWLKSL